MVIVFCLHEQAGGACWFDSALCKHFSSLCRLSGLELSNGPTHHAIRSAHGRHNFLNNSFNKSFIQNWPQHKWLKSNYPTLCCGIFFLNVYFGKLFKNLCLSCILSLLSCDVGWNLVSPTLHWTQHPHLVLNQIYPCPHLLLLFPRCM